MELFAHELTVKNSDTAKRNSNAANAFTAKCGLVPNGLCRIFVPKKSQRIAFGARGDRTQKPCDFIARNSADVADGKRAPRVLGGRIIRAGAVVAA